MSARIPPGFAEIVMSFSIAGDPEQMITAIGVDLAPGATPSLDNTNGLAAILATQMQEFCTNQYTIGPGWVVWGQDGAEDVRIDSSNAIVSGTVGTAAAPNNTAWLVRKSTDQPGRRGRGRMFIPGVDESFIDQAGALSTTARQNAQTDANTLLANLVASALVDDAVLFRGPGPLGSPPALAPAVITALTVQAKVATQRRRMRR